MFKKTLDLKFLMKNKKNLTFEAKVIKELKRMRKILMKMRSERGNNRNIPVLNR